ncbi:MAG: heavy-metal-associated domain-containing protein [Thermodesulfobacterium sp.]|jgi:copper chaperone CopZ|nr:heavy-metal-associated domain-containing protein [Thermodesulfobacterium sp.]
MEMIVQGMTYEHCLRRVEKAMLSTGKTRYISVDLATDKVSFLKDEDLELNEVVKAIELYGYKVIKT